VKGLLCIIVFLIFTHCNRKKNHDVTNPQIPNSIYIKILGISQDGGYPQAGCQKKCCIEFWKGNHKKEYVSSIAVIEPETKKAWLFDATPDFKEQIWELNDLELEGIFLTHGHIGHYTGLMHLGREAMGASDVKVYCMPRMVDYLKTNGPWSQLVSLSNIEIIPIQDSIKIILSDKIAITPFMVPHRDEFTETVGFLISGPEKSVVFVPDIDKWDQWKIDIVQVIREVNFALLDGTFYDAEELPGRDLNEIPHPFIIESVNIFNTLAYQEKNKIHFIHLNHTNPLIFTNSPQYHQLTTLGFKVAKFGQILVL